MNSQAARWTEVDRCPVTPRTCCVREETSCTSRLQVLSGLALIQPRTSDGSELPAAFMTACCPGFLPDENHVLPVSQLGDARRSGTSEHARAGNCASARTRSRPARLRVDPGQRRRPKAWP